MRTLIYITLAIFFVSCSDEIENNNIPPNPPNLVIPNNTSTVMQEHEGQEVYFEWTSATDPDNDVTGYRWFCDVTPSFSSPYHFSVNSNNATAYLPPNQTYYWRIQAIDSNGNLSSYSQTWSFYLDGFNDPPSEPILIFPIDETECSNSTLTFQWNHSTDLQGDNVSYTLHIDSSPQFNESPNQYDAFGNNEFTLTLPQGAHLYWKIEASDGQESSFSEVRSLYTQGLGNVNTIPQLQYLSPQDGAIVNGNSITLSWIGSDQETSNGNLTYRIYASEVGTSPNLLQEGNNIQYTLSNLQTDTEYQWLVYVTDEDGATNLGEIQRFYVQ